MLPQRIRMDEVRNKPRRRSPAHRDWVRSHRCCVPGCQLMPIEVAHVRIGTDGSMGRKPSDKWCLSLRRDHHAQQHQLGESSFERRHSISMHALAAEFFRRSPHRGKLD